MTLFTLTCVNLLARNGRWPFLPNALMHSLNKSAVSIYITHNTQTINSLALKSFV